MRVVLSVVIFFAGTVVASNPLALDSSAIEKRKLLSPFSAKLRSINVGSAAALQGIANFMGRNLPIPFFEIPEMGQIRTFWAEEIELLSRASREKGTLSNLEKGFQNAVSAINKLGWALNPMETIKSPESKTRLHAAKIQQLLLALKIVRIRDSELLDPDTGDELLLLVTRIIEGIPTITKDSKSSDLYEWALNARMKYSGEQKGVVWGIRKVELSSPVRGFGPAIMTLLAILKDTKHYQSLRKGFIEEMKESTQSIFDSDKARIFVRDFNSCPIKVIKTMIEAIVNWLNAGAENDSPLKTCTGTAGGD